MQALRWGITVSAWFAVITSAHLRSEEQPITLTNAQGASISFSESEGAWTWTVLKIPGGPVDGWSISEWGIEVATSDRADTLSPAWILAEHSEDRVVFEQLAPSTGLRLRRVYSFGSTSNTLRVETRVQSTGGNKVVATIGLLTTQFTGEPFRETGPAPASFPLFGDLLFVGVEHVSADSRVLGDASDIVQLIQRPRRLVDETWQLIATSVVGWPIAGVGDGWTGEPRLREAFLHYLDSVRIKPDRIVLHTDTWWTVPNPLTEANVLSDLAAAKKGFLDRTGMFFDTYCVDLGWSDPRTFWRMDTRRFPNELRVINNQVTSLGAKLGLWMSPGSGYPDGLNNAWLQSQGYEMTPFESLGQAPCFALGGRYQREFKERLVSYAEQYDLGHVILDFMPQQCDVASHGHPVGVESRYAIDAGVADVLDSLRAVNPRIALEPMVCGYPPSPWWLMKTPFVLGPVGDDVPYGRVPCPDWIESLISARDMAYRAGQEAWIMPTQALVTWDMVLQTPGDFQNMAVMAVGRGRWFLSTYLKPSLMKPEDWDFLAALVRWLRQNKQYFGNAWQFGGRAEDREAYGFMFRNAGKDFFCVRNPWIEPRTIELPASPLATAPRDVRTIYPRRATVGRVQPGDRGMRITVAPYETLLLETVPSDESVAVWTPTVPEAGLVAAAPRITRTAGSGAQFQYAWSGALTVPDVAEPELCVLVTGGTDVNRTIARITIAGREVTPAKSTSAGQFGAATDVAPENWIWFIAPLPKGDPLVQIELNVPPQNAAVGIFLRGVTAANNDPAPEAEVTFPTFRAERRAWSQTLQPMQDLADPPR
jgi:hypothetical protein